MTVDISKVVLLDVQSGKYVEADLLDAIQERQISDWEDLWAPALQEGLERLVSANAPKSSWPQNRHWNWREKSEAMNGLLCSQGFSLVCDGVTQGLIAVNMVSHHCRLPEQQGKDLVYIDLLENAPWNRSELLFRPIKFKGVGTMLMAAAIELSREQGFKGRLGLHALPQSERWYRETCGMTDMGIDQHAQGLRYFEMTAQQASAFILKGGSR